MPDLDPRAVHEDPDHVAVGEDLGDEARDVGGRGQVGRVDVGFAS